MKLTFEIHPRNGNRIVDELRLESNQCLVGRQNVHLKIRDLRCSRRHAMIYIGGHGQLRLRDLNSRNGTYVNHRAILDTALYVGQPIRLGDVTLYITSFEPSVNLPPVLPFSKSPPPLPQVGNWGASGPENEGIRTVVVDSSWWPSQSTG